MVSQLELRGRSTDGQGRQRQPHSPDNQHRRIAFTIPFPTPHFIQLIASWPGRHGGQVFVLPDHLLAQVSSRPYRPPTAASNAIHVTTSSDNFSQCSGKLVQIGTHRSFFIACPPIRAINRHHHGYGARRRLTKANRVCPQCGQPGRHCPRHQRQVFFPLPLLLVPERMATG